MWGAPFASSWGSSRQIFGTVPALSRRTNIPSPLGFQRVPNNAANRDPMNRILSCLDLNTTLSLYDPSGPLPRIREASAYRLVGVGRSDREITSNFTFYPPDDISNTDLPPSLEYLNEIQQIFANYNRNNEEQTHKLIDFIETYIYTGLREFSTNIFIRPQKVKDYVYLYSLLSRNVKIIARYSFCCTPIFSQYLFSENICPDFEARQLSGSLPNMSSACYLQAFSELINGANCQEFKQNEKEIIEAFIDDDSDKLIEITSRADFDFETEMFGGKRSTPLIHLAAMYGSVNCFKYLLMNNPKLDEIANFAVVGGNKEIIRILMQTGVKFNQSATTALYFRRDEIFDWIKSEIFSETQEDPNNIAYAITETCSIRAIYALTLTNELICSNDWLSVFVLDGMVDWCRELSKSCIFLSSLFFTLTDEEVLNNLLEKTTNSYFGSLFSEAVQTGYAFHLRVLVHHPNFDFFEMEKGMLKIIKDKYTDIYDEIQAKTHAVVSEEKAYQIFTHGLPINEDMVFGVMKYCIKVNDSFSFSSIASKYPNINLSIDQLIELLRLSSITWLFVASQIIAKQPDPSIFVLLVRYYFTSIDNGLLPPKIADIVLKDANLMAQLTPFDCINLFLMVRPEISDFSPLISLFQKFELISDAKSVSDSQSINAIRSIVLNSPKIDQYIQEDIEGLVNIIPSTPKLLKKVIGVEVSKEFFDKILLFYIKIIGGRHDGLFSKMKYYEDPDITPEAQKIQKLITNFLLHPVNKKHIDIKELCKSKYNAHFLRLLEYSDEEFEYLKNIEFMKGRLMFNPKNARFFTLPQILKCQNPHEIVNAILNIPLTPEQVTMIEDSNFMNLSDRVFVKHCPSKMKTLIRKVFIRDEICNGFRTRTLLNYLLGNNIFDEISTKMLNALLSRNLTDKEMADIFINIPTEQRAINYVLSRRNTLNNSCLIIYSVRIMNQIVEKGTPIEDAYFTQLFNARDKINYEALFEYKISKPAIANALLKAIEAKNIDAMKFLISKGAPVNIILNSVTPLQTAINTQFVDGVKVLLDNGASIGFNGTKTAAKTAESYPNMQIVKIICSRIDVQYEARFECLKSIHIPTAQKTVQTSQFNDIIKDINLLRKSDFDIGKPDNFRLDNILDFTVSSDFKDLLTGHKNSSELKDFVEGSLKLCKTFEMALNIIVLFTPVGLGPIEILIPSLISKRIIIPNVIKSEIWNIIVNYADKSSPAFKAVYSIITGIDIIQPHPDLAYLLFIATRFGRLPIIQSLISKGADINLVEGYFQFFSPSLEAISKDRSDILKLFIESGLDVNQIYAVDNYTLINAAIEFNSFKCFDILLEKASLQHVVVQTPMMVALKTFELTQSDYFINKLMDKIDIEHEKIVNISFEQFLDLKAGKVAEFHYLAPERPILTVNPNRNLPFRFGGMNNNEVQTAQDLINSDIVQKKLAFETLTRPLYKALDGGKQKYVEDITPEDELITEYEASL